MAIGEFQPIDFIGMQGGFNNMPGPASENALRLQQQGGQAQLEALQGEAMQRRAQAQAAEREGMEALEFRSALDTHLGDGSARSTAQLMTRFPKFAKQLQDAHALERADVQEADTMQLNDIYSRASNGDWAGAASHAQRRFDAEKAAGNDTSDEQELLDALNSGDPVKQKRALGIVGMDLAGRVGLDKFSSAYGGVTTQDGNIVNRGTGAVTYQGEPNVRGVVVGGGTDEYGNPRPSRLVNPVTGADIGGGGSDPAAAPGGVPATGSRAARNNNPGNIRVSEWTKKQPGFTGEDGGFATFETPAAGAAAMTSLLGNYWDGGKKSIGAIISKWAPASDGNNVNAYVSAVSKMTGIPPGKPLTRDDLPAVQQAMAQVEGGGPRSAPGERSQKELEFRYGKPPAGQILTQDGKRIRDPLSEKGAGKALPASTLDKINTQAETTAQVTDLLGGFQDTFSGPGFGNATGAVNLAGRMGVDAYAAQADWWQRMNGFDNVVRNELFGASLTQGEQDAWERTTVTPTMDAKRVRANLAKRQTMLQRALDRKLKTYGAAGYNVDDVGAVIGGGAPATAINFADLP